MVKLYYVKKCFVIFQSSAPGITPKTPSGSYASLATTQQSQRVTLSIVFTAVLLAVTILNCNQ